MNKNELIKIIENIEKNRCPIYHGGSCNMDCCYRIDGCYGDECMFDSFVKALENDDKLEYIK